MHRFLLVWMLLVSATSSAMAEGELRPIKHLPDLLVPDLLASDKFLQHEETLFLNARSGKQDRRLVLLSLVTQDTRTIADGIADFRVLAADDHRVAIAEKSVNPSVTVFDLRGSASRTFCCFKRAWEAYFAGEELRLLSQDGPEMEVRHLDLSSGQITRTTPLPAAEARAFWSGRLIAIHQRPPKATDRKLTIYDGALALAAELTIPNGTPRGNLGCRTGDHAISRSHLVYVTGCGNLNIVALASPKHERVLPYFAQAPHYRLAATDDLLFALPQDTSEPLSIFRLSDGMQIARRPMEGNRIAAYGNILAVFQTDGRIALYEIDVARLTSQSHAETAAIEACRTARNFPGGTPAASRIAAMESGPVSPLLANPERLGSEGLDCVHFYARQLGRTIDRIEEGVALLERVQALKPSDMQIAHDIAAARGRLALLQNGDPDQIPAVREGMELTIGTGADGLGPEILLSGSRLFAWQWGDLGDNEMVCGTVAAYDRKNLQLQTVAPIVACDSDFQDSISAVVEGNSKLYVSIRYRFEQKGRTDLVVLRGDDLGEISRHHLMGSINNLVPSEDGLIACSTTDQCMHWNWSNLELPPKPTTAFACPPKRSHGPPTQRDFPKTVQGPIAWYPIACGERFVAIRREWGERARIEMVDLTRPEKPIAAIQAPHPAVAIDEAKSRVAISSYTVENFSFQTVDLATGVVRQELSLRHDNEGSLPWALYDELLVVGRGRDLVIHNLANGKTLDYVKDFISSGQEHGRNSKRHRIQHLILDEQFSRLIALTRDGHRSRVIELDSLTRDLARDSPAWSKLDEVLAGDSGRM